MMRQIFYKVTDHPELVKDSHSKAILNTDIGAIARHEQRLVAVQKDLRRTAEINNLKNELSEVKDLLKKLLETKTEA